MLLDERTQEEPQGHKRKVSKEVPDQDVRLQRHNEMCERGGSGTSPLMGKLKRHPFTGITQVDFMTKLHDYAVVDFWTRPCMFGTVMEFSEDQYVFRPLPLQYRTWIYHHFYSSGRVQTQLDPDALDTSVDALLRETLECRCIDSPVSAGRWSPIIMFLPIGFGASMTADFSFICVALAMVVFLHLLTTGMNSPENYQKLRLVTLPARLGFFFYLLAVVANPKGPDSGAIGVLGGIFCICCSIFDLVAGDVQAAMKYSLLCTYKVVRELPNRVFICQRDGAAWGTFGGDLQVSENVTGMPKWQPDWALIADIKGILVELRPMRKQDWFKVSDDYMTTHEPPVYYGLDVYDEELPTAHHIVTAAKLAVSTALPGAPVPPEVVKPSPPPPNEPPAIQNG